MGIQGDVYETKVRHRTKAVDVALAQRCSIREVADQRSGKFAPGELKDRIHTAVKHGFIYARRYEEFGMDIRRRYFVNNFIDYARVKLLADPVRRGIWAEFANCVAFDISLYREQPWRAHETAIREFGEMGVILTALIFIISREFWVSFRRHAAIQLH